MLILSLVLHLGLALALTLSHHRPASTTLAAASGSPTVNLILLRSFDTPDPTVAPVVTATHPSVPGKATFRPAPSAPPEVATKPGAAAPPPSLALAARMNARLRALPPEAILSPNHAPHLDGSNGIVFLLDISGSMCEPFQNSTRLTFAREALCRRIRALGEGTPFAVILYADRSSRSGPLVGASEATRDAAERFVWRDVNCGGGTNLPDGLAWAAQLHAGRLLVVSDGELNMRPTELLTKSRAVLGLKGKSPVLNILAIAPRATTDDGLLLQSLASQQGGTYQEESLDHGGFLTANRASSGTP